MSPIPSAARTRAFAVLLAVGAALVPACATRGVASPQPLAIELAPAGADGWRLTFRAERPIERLDFLRESAFRRAESWRLVTPGYRFGVDGRREHVALEPGAKAGRALEFVLPTDTSVLYKDYEQFQRFTDGGVIAYTGHLAAALPGPAPTARRMRMVPRDGERVIVGGRISATALEWDDGLDNGTYAYFGRRTPIESASIVAVLDPGLPPWLVRRLDLALPRLFADYAALSGRELAIRPMVLFSFAPSQREGSSSWKGGVLPGVIQLHMELAADAPEDPEAVAQFVQFIAHEAAHLWNGDLYSNAGRDASWLHEGGADAFAWRALRRMDLIDDAGLEAREVEALNECLRVLGERPLDSAEQAGDFAPVYPCGALLAWYSELALAHAGAKDDLHGLWRRVFAAAATRGGRYDETTYLDALRAAGASVEAVGFIDAFAHQPMPDRRARLVAAFAAVGAPLSEQPPPRARLDTAVRDALVKVMAGDCNGAVSLSVAKGGYQIHGSSRCATLTRELKVARVQGAAIATAPGAALAALAAACGPGGTVTLDGGEGTPAVRVACGSPVPAAPTWLARVR